MGFWNKRHSSPEEDDSDLSWFTAESFQYISKPSTIKEEVKWQSSFILDDLHARMKKKGDAFWYEEQSGFHDPNILRAFSGHTLTSKERKESKTPPVHHFIVKGNFIVHNSFNKNVNLNKTYSWMRVTMNGGFILRFSNVTEKGLARRNSKGDPLIAFTLIDPLCLDQIIDLGHATIAHVDKYPIVGRNYGFLDLEKLHDHQEVSISSATSFRWRIISIWEKVSHEDIWLLTMPLGL